jgi:biopolymer transport protein ExbD
MKRKQRVRDGGADSGPMIDISSMVDVSFLLLIYFLVAATIMPQESDLVMQLPRPGVSSPDMPDLTVRVTVAGDGSVRWGSGEWEETVEAGDGGAVLTELRSRLSLAVAAVPPGRLPVMLSVADGAGQQRVIDVLNCFAGLGISQVALVERVLP